MKRIKKVFLLLLGGFLAFAPPGPMIFLFILFVGIFRDRPFIVAGLLALGAALAAWLLWRRRAAQRDRINASKP